VASGDLALGSRPRATPRAVTCCEQASDQVRGRDAFPPRLRMARSYGTDQLRENQRPGAESPLISAL
jgi:hypothetical protein